MKLSKHKKILDLLGKDQENIKKYYKKEIDWSNFERNGYKISQQFLKHIEKNNFPFKNTATEEEYKAGIVLSLHLPVEGLKIIFKKIEKLSGDEIDLKHKAFFIDKIKVAENKPQIYGTQVKKKENGEVELMEIEDEYNINKRRKEMKMENIEDYLKKINS